MVDALRERGSGVVQATVDIAAPVPTVFAAATDWEGQGGWIPLTTVRVVAGDGHSAGSIVEAVTGRGMLAVTDTFEITRWDPPHAVDVLHIGPVVRGPGAFSFEPRPDGRTRFTWIEWLHLPLGVLGRLGWPVVRPGFAGGLRAAQRRLARAVEREQ